MLAVIPEGGGAKCWSEMNAPDRYERFVVPEGTKKWVYSTSTPFRNIFLENTSNHLKIMDLILTIM